MSRNFSAPSQHDNPNAVAGIILQELRGAGLPCDYPPAKVKQGHGETVLQILDSACDSVLAAQHFSWARPAHKTDEYDDEAEVDESAELDDGIDDAIAIEEEEGLYMDGLTSPGGANSDPNESPSRREIMESSVPAAQWKMELERVAPQLKAIQSVDHKEWRAHLEQTKYGTRHVYSSCLFVLRVGLTLSCDLTFAIGFELLWLWVSENVLAPELLG